MSKKILVIDDEELLTKTFSRMLEKRGYEVFIAKNGQDACEIAEEEVFDLIITDIKMPGIDGIETVKQLRNIFLKRKKIYPPEIFITGFADEHQEKEAKKLNPVAYILKPFDVQMLLQRIENAIN